MIISFAVVDPDNDYIKCRMAEEFFECGGICNGLTNASLDEVSISCWQYIVSVLISDHSLISLTL